MSLAPSGLACGQVKILIPLASSMARPREELDRIDLEVLRLLQRNARIPHSKLAEKLKVPEATVKHRVHRLMERGVIKGFYTLLDPRKVGFPFSLIALIDTSPEDLDEIFNRIREMPEATHVFKLTGKYNVPLITAAR